MGKEDNSGDYNLIAAVSGSPTPTPTAAFSVRSDGKTTINAGGLVVSAGGATVNGGVTVGSQGITVTSGGVKANTGVTVDSGGLRVTDGGAHVKETTNAFAAKFENNFDTFAGSTGNTAAALIIQTKKAAADDFNLIKAQVNGVNENEAFRVDGKGTVIVSSDVDATASTEGSIRTQGGLGVKLKANFGGNIDAAGTVATADTTDSASKVTGALTTAGGLGVALKAHIGTGLTVDAGGATITAGGFTVSESTDTAALTVQSSNAAFTKDVMVLNSATTATATGDFDYIQAQT